MVPEPQWLPIVSPQPKPMVSEQLLPHVLPMPRPIPLPDTVPKVVNQPLPFQGIANPRPLDIASFGTLPGYNNDIDDIKQPKVPTRQPDKAMYRNLGNCLVKFKMR